MSKAQEQFDALPEWKKLRLVAEVFKVLEYDTEGNPGATWSADTAQWIGDTFNTFGVTFTVPGR